MKSIFILIFAMFCLSVNATNYYISAGGNDSNSGTSSSTPWKTLNKLNSYFSSLKPGDNVYLNRGDVFYGAITVNNSGSSGSPITIGAYGTGPDPVITGFTTITGWTNLGGNIWESSYAVSTLATCNIVLINGVNTPMGRYPNSDYLPYQNHSGTTSITSSSLTATPNWTGAQLVMRSIKWMLEINPITAQSGGTLTYSGGSSAGTNGYGFFIQNDVRTLDVQNEWYFNPSTKKIRIFSTPMPANVQIPTLDGLALNTSANYITYDHIDFEGANSNIFENRSSQNVTVQNCTFRFAGRDGMLIDNAVSSNETMTIDKNMLSDINEIAMNFLSWTSNIWIKNNTIRRVGLIPGAGTSTQNTGDGIVVKGAGTTVEYNNLDSICHSGMYVNHSNNVTFRYNTIQAWGMVRYDAGAIYSWNTASDTSGVTSRVMDHNILINSNQIASGINGLDPDIFGVYLDGSSKNTSVTNNTISNCKTEGIHILNSGSVTVTGNTCYNNASQLGLWHAFGGGMNVTNNIIKNNLFIGKPSSQLCLFYRDDDSDFNPGAIDNNYYARPMNDSLDITTQVVYTATSRNLSGWQISSGQDVHSKKSPKTITDVNDLRFEYNASSSTKTVSLDAIYTDVVGNTYSGSATLAPYSSVVLIKTGALINQPIANASQDQTIALPVDSVDLSGSATDANGVITSYNWTKVSGPSTYTIVNSTSASTVVKDLVQGTYQFEFKVTDNSGATGKDTMQVIVKPANIPPVANAGQDQTITLPTNSLTFSGSGSDADGTISSYSWTKISGPSSYTITNAASPGTPVIGLVQGVYQFRLAVTDDNGATGSDTMQVTVNPAPNQPPVANAGSDQAITLPANSTTLTGTGTDADGTVVSYLWTKVSGPSLGTLNNANSASASVRGLTQGIYQFQLTVTDNRGATGTDVVLITVNPAANMPPVANAGTDQTITLPVNTTTLSGSGSDADGIVTGYAWTQISGPSGYSILNVNSAITSVTGLVQGVYQFQLQVTDNSGAIGTDIVQITVNAAANIPPTANAGSDQTITLPVNTITLSGSGSDADGMVESYIWTQISGPSSYNIVNANSSVTNVTGLVKGVYQFQLQVTDNNGAVGTDVMQVTVNAAANIPPVANAGSDQTIILPLNTITLSGSGTDADGTLVSYNWTQISGPAGYSFVNANSPFTDVTGLTQGVYKFQLTVTDNAGATGTDIIAVTVDAATNIPPVANAGPDQSITLPVSTATLSGSGTDADGTVVSYSWTQISGPTGYSIVNTNSAITDVTGLVQGIYQFQLEVTDNNGAIGTDIVQVTVNPGANIPPISNAGPDQSITLPVNTITLSGSGSDADGTVASYSWTQISGPSSYNIINANSAVTNLTGLVQGVYQFQLQVTDNNGAVAADIVQINVNAAPNQPPVASAGTDQTITLPVNSVTLSGSGSDADGTVVSYSWQQISGPSGYNIANTNSPVTDVTNLVQGVYQFELTVTDNSGATGSDIIQVIVKAAANIPPTANAGSDQTITLPLNSITLSGSGTDVDGTVVGYKWTKISGPSSYNIANSNSAVTNVTSLVSGVYQFQLKVTDNQGATATDIIRITVNVAANIPPTANAGADQAITLPVNTITLSGSGNDADGTVVSYVWTQISGPSGYNIVNANSPVTDVSGLIQGVYQFQLQVTDNNGAVGTDIMQVTVNVPVNIPPVANAGSDQTITLPIDSVTLLGSGTDADGIVVGYLWTKISGPATFNIVNPTLPSTSITGLAQGIYLFELQVTDDNGATSGDTVQVTVNAATNIQPVANAGPDQTITLPVNSITLSGSGSDVDGTVAGYSWTKISGPSSYNIVNANSPGTNVTGLVQGVYQFVLTVADNNGASGTDTIQVTVNIAGNINPTANAGSDKTITLPTNSVTLNGSGTDADGTIAGYSWTLVSGPSAYTIVNPTSASTSITGLVQGVYQFQLQVTDNKGATGTDIVRVTVNAAPNVPPVANAGSDLTITLPINSVTLTGSGTDADGTIAGYVWTKISGPSSYSIVNTNSAITGITGLLKGVYKFQLKVTDNNGATGTDVVKVTVNAAANIPPVANAGPDQSITLPVNTVSLTGSGSDADGTVTNYAWTRISGPASYNIVNASSAATNITGLVQGVYQFQLKVTDNSGAIGTDIVQITVNPAPNQLPVANAGPDQNITLPTNIVTLSGSGTDADGTIAGYLWTQISGPSGYTIVSATSAVTNVTGLVAGVYQFQLQVTDNSGGIGTDIVQVTVNTAPNLPPVADAGTDKTITLPTNSLTVTGSGTDADGTVVSYQWTKISGPASYNIVNVTSAGTGITGLVQGVYQFQLTVTDNNGATGTDVMQVTVNAAPNQLPVANAGPDQSIILPTNSLNVSGSGTDADGTVVGYQWTKISGPASYNIVNASSAATNITGLVQGVYQFQLKVTDNSGATATDIMQVIVNAAANIPPVANAGADWTITLPINSLTVSGSGTDADGTVAGYQWTKISGPSSYNIVNASSAVTNIAGLVQGVYQFQLKVTDNSGATGTDIMQVTVNPAPNIPPVANAGTDKTITLPTNSITVTGSGSDADGTVTGYQWTKISGPASYNIVNATSAATGITGLVQGVYQFQLTVTDNNGGTGTDVMQVIVNAAPNQPPVANAGADQSITLPTNFLTVTGSGTDVDGTVVSYQWTKISGPSSYNIVNATSAVTSITGLAQGVYQFQLKVTDNSGATGTDIMQVAVNPAPNIPPVANAGADQTITLPTNSLTITGSGSDVDGTVAGYQWTKISGPSSYNIVNTISAVTNITGLVQGVYQFQLKVTDNSGTTATDIMQVTVNAAANQPPAADAGPDQIITLPTNSVAVSGSGTDIDGTITGYQWTKISGPATYNVVSSTQPATIINGLVQGVYLFELRVTDNNGARGRDTMQITVNAAVNIPPIAHAGADVVITLPVNASSLAGSGSDADGTVVSYQWTKIFGPSTYSITNSLSPVTDVAGLIAGVYKFELLVTDNNGATGRDTMQLIVNSTISNIAPIADAGKDQTITLPANSVTLSGSGTDADGIISGYSWVQVSGPSVSAITSPNNAITLASNLVGGTYEFELTVTDNMGAIGKDTVTIVVAEPRLNNSVQSNVITAYPNPVVDITTLEINTTQVYSRLMIVVMDMYGHVAYQNEITPGQSDIKQKMDMSNFAKGTYLITVYFNDKQKQSIKVIRL